jgi:hypothetical protein
VIGDPWVVSNGGPLLLLPRELLRHWTGVDAPRDGRVVEARFRWNPEQPASDYDLACDVAGYTGVLPVGPGWGLVIGDEPNPARWLARDDGGIIVRWEAAPSDEAMDAAIRGLPAALQWEAEGEFRVFASPLELFDSGEPGLEALMPRATIDLAPGVYQVEQTRYAPDEEVALHLIRLRRAA